MNPTSHHQSPGDDEGPLFAEAWHADLYAVIQALLDSAVLTEAEWMSALSDVIASRQQAGDPDLGDTYYEHCLTALEAICVDKSLTSPAAVDGRAEQWREAYLNTPHGQPVKLSAAGARDR